MYVYAGDDDMMREHDTVESTIIDDTQEHTQDETSHQERGEGTYYYNLLDRDFSTGEFTP